jgi:hypothetical protein
MNTFIRLCINFIAIAVVILIFRHFNWIQFQSPSHLVNDPTLNDIIIAGIIGVIMTIIGELAGIAYTALVIVTCGLGCILYPLFCFLLGYIKLIGTQMILPDWFTFDPIWWKVIIISIAIGLVRIPSPKEQKKIIVKGK